MQFLSTKPRKPCIWWFTAPFCRNNLISFSFDVQFCIGLSSNIFFSNVLCLPSDPDCPVWWICLQHLPFHYPLCHWQLLPTGAIRSASLREMLRLSINPWKVARRRAPFVGDIFLGSARFYFTCQVLGAVWTALTTWQLACHQQTWGLHHLAQDWCWASTCCCLGSPFWTFLLPSGLEVTPLIRINLICFSPYLESCCLLFPRFGGKARRPLLPGPSWAFHIALLIFS